MKTKLPEHLLKQIGLNNINNLKSHAKRIPGAKISFSSRNRGSKSIAKKPSSATRIIGQEYVRQQTQSTFHYIILGTAGHWRSHNIAKNTLSVGDPK